MNEWLNERMNEVNVLYSGRTMYSLVFMNVAFFTPTWFLHIWPSAPTCFANLFFFGSDTIPVSRTSRTRLSGFVIYSSPVCTVWTNTKPVLLKKKGIRWRKTRRQKEQREWFICSPAQINALFIMSLMHFVPKQESGMTDREREG